MMELMCFQRDMKVFYWLCKINLLALYVIFKLELIFSGVRPQKKQNKKI